MSLIFMNNCIKNIKFSVEKYRIRKAKEENIKPLKIMQLILYTRKALKNS